MELTGGHADAGEPEGQLAGVVGKISMDSGVNVQLDTLGSPEHERVTNIGEVSAALSSGTTVTAIVPALPAVRLSGSVEGATGASEREKPGVELAWAVAFVPAEAELRCDASPA